MGCDYYVIKSLIIYYDNIFYKCVTFEKNECYYNFETENGYMNKEDFNSYKKQCLTSDKDDIIYINNKFNDPLFETLYKKYIDNELNINFIPWNRVTKILKGEYRYERI